MHRLVDYQHPIINMHALNYVLHHGHWHKLTQLPCRTCHAGTVEGVLWYFPYENDAETLPLDPSTTGRMMLTSGLAGSDATAATAAAAAASQRPFLPSQAANRQTQRVPGAATQMVGGKRSREEEEMAAANEQSEWVSGSLLGRCSRSEGSGHRLCNSHIECNNSLALWHGVLEVETFRCQHSTWAKWLTV